MGHAHWGGATHPLGGRGRRWETKGQVNTRRRDRLASHPRPLYRGDGHRYPPHTPLALGGSRWDGWVRGRGASEDCCRKLRAPTPLSLS